MYTILAVSGVVGGGHLVVKVLCRTFDEAIASYRQIRDHSPYYDVLEVTNPQGSDIYRVTDYLAYRD